MLIRYIIYGLIGMNMEIFWTGLSEIRMHSKNLVGHTSLWMFLIYGLAAFTLEPLHNLIQNENIFFRGCSYATIIFLIEFFSGYILRLFGIEAWHYTTPLSVMGLIRLDYAPIWFIVGLIFEKIHIVLLNTHIGKI